MNKIKEAIERLEEEAPNYKDSLKSILTSCKMAEACDLSKEPIEKQIEYLLSIMDIDRLILIV